MSPKNLIAQGQARLAKAEEPDPAAQPAGAAPDAASSPQAPPPPPRPPQRRQRAAAQPSAPPTADGPGEIPPAGPEHWPVHLDRAEPAIPLNVKVPWSLRHGVRLLAIREGTDIQDEVAEALRAHFAAKNFTPPDFWQRG